MPHTTNKTKQLPITTLLWPFFLSRVRTIPEYEKVENSNQLHALVHSHLSRNQLPKPFRPREQRKNLYRWCVSFWKHTGYDPHCNRSGQQQSQRLTILKDSTIPNGGKGLFLSKSVKRGQLLLFEYCLKHVEEEKEGKEGDNGKTPPLIKDKECYCPVAFAHRISKYQRKSLEEKEYGYRVSYNSNNKNSNNGREEEEERDKGRREEYVLGNYIISRTKVNSHAIMSGPIAMVNHACEPFDNVCLVETGTKPRVWILQAGEDLEAGEEIFWNYGEDYWNKINCKNPHCCCPSHTKRQRKEEQPTTTSDVSSIRKRRRKSKRQCGTPKKYDQEYCHYYLDKH